jgi:hypothetical protein
MIQPLDRTPCMKPLHNPGGSCYQKCQKVVMTPCGV